MPTGAVAALALSRTGVFGVGRVPALISRSRPRLSVEALLDRIVRGRAWIPVLGVALIGIVVMQVEVLKLGASVGRSMNTATELSSQIQIERAQVSSLASPARIQRLAADYGLSEPGPTDNHFVSSHTSVTQAVKGIHAVDAGSFTANLTQEQAVDDLVPTQAVQAAEATDASLASNLADEDATGSTAAAESQAAATSTAAGTTVAGTTATPTTAGGTTAAVSSDTAAVTGLTNTAAAPSTDSADANVPATTAATDPTIGATDPTTGAAAPTTGAAGAIGATDVSATNAASSGGSGLTGAAAGTAANSAN